MELYQIIVIIVGVAALAAIFMCLYYGKNYLSYSKVFSPIVSSLYTVVKGISSMAPNNTILSTVCLVIGAAIDATESAEKAWLAGEAEKQQKNHIAKNLISDLLVNANITVTPAIEQIIDGTIAVVCMLLPHERDYTQAAIDDGLIDEEPVEKTEEE